MKRTFVPLAVAAAFCVTALQPARAQAGSNLVIAGESIGQIHLGRYGAASLAKLPKPDADDSGMGQYRSVWLSRKPGGRTDTLFIHSVSNSPREIKPTGGVSIKLIRVTSPWYRTPDGLSTGSVLVQILRRFPGARPKSDNQSLYDDVKRGITFEFAGRATSNSPCIAIMVHPATDENAQLETDQQVHDLLRSNGLKP
ncbi:MAG TPA: hypothetical protein VGD78_22635 [Chthoniobacterales bacterium]